MQNVGSVGEKIMRVIEMKTKLEEKIKALEKEKGLLLEEVRQLKEVVELSEKAKDLENEVNKLKKEVETLKDKIPQELLQELGELASPILKGDEEEEKFGEECSGCEEEELL
jgi:peptidoglycan hydrolase CwlO-like protein